MTSAKATRYVALLRGINLGSARRVAMADLRNIIDGCGYDDCVTYLQSGNAVFSSTSSASDVQVALEKAIAKSLAMNVAVVVRSAGEMAKVVSGNPFPKAAADGTRLHVSFLSDKPSREAIALLTESDIAPDEISVKAREIYFSLPYGLSKSKVMKVPWDKRLGVVSTMRNWNTVTKLAGLSRA